MTEPTDQRVTHIVLNPYLTGGHDFDKQPGDDGVSIIVEPRNAADEFVSQAGPVSVVVIDPDVPGPAGRIARWDFELAEATKRFKKTRMGRGIHLTLPWPNQPPQHNNLKVFVRYETQDGQKLQTRRDITVALPGQYAQRWTPRPLEPSVARNNSGSSAALVGHNEELAPFAPLPPVKKPATPTARRPSWNPNR